MRGSLAILIVLLLIVSPVSARRVAAGNISPSNQVKVTYTITIDNESRELIVDAEIPLYRDSTRLEVNWLPPGASIELKSYEGCRVSQDWTVKRVSDICKVRYVVHYDFYEILNQHSTTPGITEGFAAIGLENILAYYPDLLDERAEIMFVLPNGWELCTSIKPEANNTITAELRRFLRMNVIAGKVTYKYSIPSNGKIYTYVLFEKPHRPIYSRGFNQVPLITRDVLLDEEARESLNEVIFYTQRLEELFGYPSPERFTITGLAHVTPHWNGFWHFDHDIRQDHIAHHIVHTWTSVLYIHSYSEDPRKTLGLNEGLPMYYSFTLAYEYTKERRYLGHHYMYYLLYMRGGRDRLKRWSSEDEYVEKVSTYLYGYIIAVYLERQLNEVGKTLADAYAEALSRYQYTGISLDDFLDIVEEMGADIDRDAIYSFDLDVYEYEREHYFDDFEDTVKFFVLNHEMPPAIFYAFIDIEANRGNPEHTPYLPTPYVEDELASQSFRNFVKELQTRKNVSKEEFLNLLTEYGGKSDFFEFYSNHTSVPPTMESINYWLSGDYSRLIRKISYAMSLMKRLQDIGIDVSKEKQLINEAFRYALHDKYSEANELVTAVLEDIHKKYATDRDKDEIPDFIEAVHGTSSTNSDSDGDGIPDELDLGMSLDGSLWDWNKLYVEVEGVKNIKWARAFKSNGTTWIAIKLSKPAYEFVDKRLRIHLGDIEYPIFAEYSFWGRKLTYPAFDGNIFKYSMILNDTIELAIPDVSFWEKYGMKLHPIKIGLDDEYIHISEVPDNTVSNATVVYGFNRVDKEYAEMMTHKRNITLTDDANFAKPSGKLLVLVGGPLANSLTRQYMVDFRIFPHIVTNEWPGKHKGVIMATIHNGRVIVILAGSDRLGTKAAVETFLKLGYIPSTPILVEYSETGSKVIRILR